MLIDTNLIHSIEPAGVFVVPVHVTLIFCPSLTVGADGDTTNFSLKYFGLMVTTATWLSVPAVLNAAHL